MRISDWSSDVCSSDLEQRSAPRDAEEQHQTAEEIQKDLGEFGAALAVGREIVIGEIGRFGEKLVDAEIGHQGEETEHHPCSSKAIDRQPATDRNERIGDVLEQPPRRDSGLPHPRGCQRSEEHTSELQSLMRISK